MHRARTEAAVPSRASRVLQPSPTAAHSSGVPPGGRAKHKMADRQQQQQRHMRSRKASTFMPAAPRSRWSRSGSRTACCLLAASAVATQLTAEAWVSAPVTSRHSGGCHNGHGFSWNSCRIEQRRGAGGGAVAVGRLSDAGGRRRVSCRSQATVDGESTGVYVCALLPTRDNSMTRVRT